jgi:hypothetical protein
MKSLGHVPSGSLQGSGSVRLAAIVTVRAVVFTVHCGDIQSLESQTSGVVTPRPSMKFTC